MPVSEYPFDENLSAEVNDTFTVRDVIIILLVFGGLALYVYGCIKFAWGYDYMAAIMLITCVAAGFVGKMNANDIAKNFISRREEDGLRGIPDRPCQRDLRHHH